MISFEINNKALNLMPNFSINLTKNSNLESFKCDFLKEHTFTFKVPCNANNVKLLGGVPGEIKNSFAFNLPVPCTLKIAEFTYSKGNIYINQADYDTIEVYYQSDKKEVVKLPDQSIKEIFYPVRYYPRPGFNGDKNYSTKQIQPLIADFNTSSSFNVEYRVYSFTPAVNISTPEVITFTNFTQSFTYSSFLTWLNSNGFTTVEQTVSPSVKRLFFVGHESISNCKYLLKTLITTINGVAVSGIIETPLIDEYQTSGVFKLWPDMDFIFPYFRNLNFYSEKNTQYSDRINVRDLAVEFNDFTFKSGPVFVDKTFVPMLFLKYVITNLFTQTSINVSGSFMSDVLTHSLVIFNNYSLDDKNIIRRAGLPADTSLESTEPFLNIPRYENLGINAPLHLPDIKSYEFINAVLQMFCLYPSYDEVTNTFSMSYIKDVLNSNSVKKFPVIENTPVVFGKYKGYSIKMKVPTFEKNNSLIPDKYLKKIDLGEDSTNFSASTLIKHFDVTQYITCANGEGTSELFEVTNIVDELIILNVNKLGRQLSRDSYIANNGISIKFDFQNDYSPSSNESTKTLYTECWKPYLDWKAKRKQTNFTCYLRPDEFVSIKDNVKYEINGQNFLIKSIQATFKENLDLIPCKITAFTV